MITRSLQGKTHNVTLTLLFHFCYLTDTLSTNTLSKFWKVSLQKFKDCTKNCKDQSSTLDYEKGAVSGCSIIEAVVQRTPQTLPGDPGAARLAKESVSGLETGHRAGVLLPPTGACPDRGAGRGRRAGSGRAPRSGPRPPRRVRAVGRGPGGGRQRGRAPAPALQGGCPRGGRLPVRPGRGRGRAAGWGAGRAEAAPCTLAALGAPGGRLPLLLFPFCFTAAPRGFPPGLSRHVTPPASSARPTAARGRSVRRSSAPGRAGGARGPRERHRPRLRPAPPLHPGPASALPGPAPQPGPASALPGHAPPPGPGPALPGPAPGPASAPAPPPPRLCPPGLAPPLRPAPAGVSQ